MNAKVHLGFGVILAMNRLACASVPVSFDQFGIEKTGSCSFINECGPYSSYVGKDKNNSVSAIIDTKAIVVLVLQGVFAVLHLPILHG